MPTVFITGANRGIGFEFARQYATAGWRVIGTCRKPAEATALKALGAAVHRLEVTDHAAVRALGREFADDTIDVFINNAGIYIARTMTAATVADEAPAWLESFAVNTIAPLACAGAFLAPVARSQQRKMLVIGSFAASIGGAKDGGAYVYRSSKAALNLTWRALAFDHPEVIAVVLSPGRARTEMNPRAPVAVEDSVAGLRRVIAGLTQQDSGGFFRYDGMPGTW